MLKSIIVDCLSKVKAKNVLSYNMRGYISYTLWLITVKYWLIILECDIILLEGLICKKEIKY